MHAIKLKCSNCGGLKFIGDQYYAYGKYYVDVTCVICADSKDIEVPRMQRFLKLLAEKRGGHGQK
jgi:hypothetical protein